jgi:type VI secretion system protein ImpA
MNAMLDFRHDMDAPPGFDALLAPLSPQAPCGAAMRHDPVFTEIRLLREEDDPSLPMRQWERPLKRADWPQIESLCADMLRMRSKDLQIAVWLVESWMRQRGFVGLMHGLRLLDGLLQRYWPQLHPLIDDDGDSDTRLAPLEWLNESLGTSVRLHAVLFTVDGDKPVPVTLAGWERMTAQEMAAAEQADHGTPAAPAGQLTRADIDAASGQIHSGLALTGTAVGGCLDSLRAMIAFLQQRLAEESPNLSKLENTLEAVLRILSQLQPAQPVDKPVERDQGAGATPADASPAPASGGDNIAASLPALAGATSGWSNRTEAYTTLEALADYLSEVEPHSPTPFLIRRAVNWGRMSLPDIIREEGDVSRWFNVLGIKL